MQEYLDDPSVLTKDKLKSELLANNVALPSGNPPKDVYVQLYIQNLSAQNHKRAADAFSSDDEPPPPAVSGRSRSSGRKTSRKPDKVQPDELDVTALTDEGLRAELLKLGVDAGPVVATTRKLYEKKLQELLQDGAAQPQLVHAETQVNHNGSEADLYSDKEDEAMAEPEPEPKPGPVAEPVAEPNPAPVAERPARSRGKMPVTGRTRSSQHHTRERSVDGEDPEDESVLNVRRRSRRFSDRTTLAEVRRPVLAGQKQSVSNISDHRKPDRPARAQLRSTSPTPAESKSLPEDQSPRRATKPSPATVDPVTFSPMCNISPIKSLTSPWTASDQAASRPGGVSAGGEQCGRADAWPLARRQQKITGLVSERSLAKTHSCTSQDVLARQVEKIAAGDQSTKVDERDVLKELFPGLAHTPTGISATCRRPIRGAAGRPVKSSDLWNFETSLFSPQTSTKASGCSSSYTEKLSRVTGLPSSAPSTPPTSRTSRLLAAPPAGHRLSLWIKLLLLATVATFLFLVYQAMETNTDAPFGDSEVSRG